MKRRSQDPKRKIASKGTIPDEQLTDLADRLKYGGASYHKLRPNDYGLDPPLAPRPGKSVCDDRRAVPKAEAQSLFRKGLLKGMVSPPTATGVPKYIWAVDAGGEVYEAKTKPEREIVYHGYRLGDDDAEQRRLVKQEWSRR